MNARKALLLVVCVAVALAMSACHVEKDPWPAEGNPPQATAVPIGQPTDAPADAPAPVEQDVEETAQPGGDEEPGLNG